MTDDRGMTRAARLGAVRIGLALAMVVSVTAACARGNAQAEESAAVQSAVAIRVARVIDTILSRPIVAAGTVKPKDEVALGFKVGGAIATLRVDQGDVVRGGQTLATLALGETDAAVAQTRAVAEKAERDVARARRLYADSVVTLVQLQDAETALRMARAGVQAAAVNRRYAEIVAPFDGVVLARSADAGQIVAAGATVLTLGSRGRGEVVQVAVADRDVLALRLGDPAVVRFDALGEERLTGAVSRIGAAADRMTGTYLVEITVHGGPALVSGMVGEAELRPRRGVPTKLVPLEAVLEADGPTGTVYAVSPDGRRAERHRIRVGFIDGGRVAVTQGLENVARVVTSGASYLGADSKIRVTP